MEIVGCGVGDCDRAVARVVHVPDAGVVAPGRLVADQRTKTRRVIPHDELGAVRNTRERDPDERFPGSVPCIDFAGESVRLHVDEAEILVVGTGEVSVMEPLNAFARSFVVFFQPDEDGEVREDFRPGVAIDCELHAAGEFGDGGVGARQSNFLCQCEERRNDKSRKTKDTPDLLFHIISLSKL